MGKRCLPVARTISAVYRDLGRLLSAMPGLMLRAFLIILAVTVGGELVPDRLWHQELTGEALGLAQNAVEAFLLTPILMAIHRFVILDKVTRNYTLPIDERAFGRFFGWLFGLTVLLGLPFDVFGLLQTFVVSVWTSIAAFVLSLIAAVGVALRLMILLPALAVGAPGATASHALADSKGHVLQILAVVLLALLPWPAVSYGGTILLGSGAMVTGSPLGMLFLLMSGILQTIIISLTAVTASYVFMALAAQVKRAAR